MRRLVEASLRYRLLILASAVVVIYFGITQLRHVSVDVLPEFEPPIVEVQAEALGLSAEEVESLITLNLEELLSGTSWLKSIRSTSVPGLSYIQLVFEDGTDLLRARQLVQERLSLAYTLPNVSKPPVMLQPLSVTSRAMMVGLSSEEVSPIQMSVLARWIIKPRLMGVPGVANVAIWGQRERQLQVLIDPQQLQATGVTQDQIISTTGNAMWVSPLSFLNASFPGTGGWIDTPNQRLGVQHVLPISSPEDLARLPVDGQPTLRLAQVAQVVEGYPLLIGDALLKEGSGLLLVIEKFPGANTLAVTRGVEDALRELQPGLPGITVDAHVFRSASYIEMAIDQLSSVWLMGTVLMVIVLFAFLYDWRAVLISVVAITLSLLASLLVLYLAGVTVNTMVLMGLVMALGILIEDIIVGTEHVMQRLRSKVSFNATQGIVEAVVETKDALIYATIIIILTALPLLFMPGMAGEFFRPLATTYVLVVLVAALVTLTVTPALSMMLFRGRIIPARPAPFIPWLTRRYDKVLAQILHAPHLTYLPVAVFVALALVVWPHLTQDLLPSFKERQVLINWTAAPGISLPEIYRVVTAARNELQSLAGISNVGTHIGRAVTGDQVVGINAGQMWVTLDAAADYNATLESVRAIIASYPGISGTVDTYLTERVREVVTGVSHAIVVRLYGPQREVLRAKAEEVKQSLASIDGAVDLQVSGQVEEPHVQIEVDLAAGQAVGVKPGDVRRQMATVFAGLNVGTLFEQQKVFEVVVWGKSDTRQSITDIENFLVETPNGGRVRLADIADVRVTSTPAVIEHEAISPRIDIVANVQGRDLEAVIDDVEKELSQIEFPLEYHPELLGEYVEREVAQQRLFGVAMAVAIGIFLLLQSALTSWRLAIVSFVMVLVALCGGVLAVAISGGVISLGSVIGFLAIVGVAAHHLIMSFKRVEREVQEGGIIRHVRRASQDQVVPQLASAATIIAVLVPTMFFGDQPGLEIVQPFSIVLVGGVVASTLVNLFVVPALYLRFGMRSQRDLAGLSQKSTLRPSLKSG